MRAVLLYGGRYVDGGTVRCDDFGKVFCSTDTWSWDGTKWAELRPATSPDMGLSTMAFDNATGKVILYGFNYGRFGMWVWDGTTWSAVSGPSATPEPGRLQTQMTFDPATRHVVAFGGFSNGGGDLQRMWSWGGSGWTAIDARAPLSTASSTDSTHRGLIAYQNPQYHGTGTNYIKDADSQTWRWNGSTWTQVAATADPGVFAMGMFDDPSNHRILLIGYSSEGSLQIWAWTGTDWNQLA
jgi:hypothetical protein